MQNKPIFTLDFYSARDFPPPKDGACIIAVFDSGESDVVSWNEDGYTDDCWRNTDGNWYSDGTIMMFAYTEGDLENKGRELYQKLHRMYQADNKSSDNKG